MTAEKRDELSAAIWRDDYAGNEAKSELLGELAALVAENEELRADLSRHETMLADHRNREERMRSLEGLPLDECVARQLHAEAKAKVLEQEVKRQTDIAARALESAMLLERENEELRAKLEAAKAAPHGSTCAFELSRGCKHDCPGCVQRRSDLRIGPQIPHVKRRRKRCDCWKAGL